MTVESPADIVAQFKSAVEHHNQGRLAEAVAGYDAVIRLDSNIAQVHCNRGAALSAMEKYEQALQAYDDALRLNAGFALAHNNRGYVLEKLGRLEDALASYDRATALVPGYAEAHFNKGLALQFRDRLDEALACYTLAIAADPDFSDACNNRAFVLQELQRFDEAIASARRALLAKPDDIDYLRTLGAALCESGRIAEGMDVFMRRAKILYAAAHPSSPPGEPEPVHKLRHDEDQLAYLENAGIRLADGIRSFYLEDGERLPGPAVNPDNRIAEISRRWRHDRPQIAVIDDLLTPQALKKLQAFCRGSTVWRRVYKDGYLGAAPEEGFACPLLAQIAEELRATYPAIFAEHGLHYLWAFKYDSRLNGIEIHADIAAVNVNFWITPDESNLDPARGGLVVWDVAAPPDWDFQKYNGDVQASRDFIAQTGAKPVTVPYRCNRAVIFDSDLFHKTDEISFKDGYLDRRINVTMLFGRRGGKIH